MGRKNTLFILAMIFPIIFMYNNCSRSTGDLGNNSSSSLLETENILTRGSFEFFEPEPRCSTEEGNAAQILSVDPSARQSSVRANGCAGEITAQANISGVRMKSYNPYLAYYNGRIYASSYLHQGMAGHYYYKEFCYNEEEQMDFTIQYVETTYPGFPDTFKDWVGVIMYGEDARWQGVHFDGGYYIEDTTNQSFEFIAINGSYSVEFQTPEDNQNRKAIYKESNGLTVEMNCWYHNP